MPQRRIDEARDELLEMESKLRDIQTRIAMNLREAAELAGTAGRERLFQTRLAVIDREAYGRRATTDAVRAVIDEVHVNPGAYVEDGDPVFLIHAPDRVWIEADIDESDIRHIQPGQPVAIDFDAWPDETLEGRVWAIGRTTVDGSEPNGRGGARKIPVFIDIPPVEKTVWPGMRATVNIRIR